MNSFHVIANEVKQSKKEKSTRLLRHYIPRNDGKRESTHNSPIHSSAELVSVPDNRIDSETSSDNLN